ncbi:MAG: (deoxy)nucleoside triphosphate pyrophosphohydrolase [Deltaproteobacteria bacterium]|nr:(deoxy)nucleoside triphosphate pyrophosphohydrolase [Deltaproteobacteria bacterium]
MALRDELKTLLVTAGVIIEKKKVLVTQRMEGAPRGLLWEFPGGKVKEGEDPRDALRREFKEELDVDVEVGKIIEAVFHTYPEYPILLLAYHCRIKKGVPKPIGCRDLKWVSLKELTQLAMPPADKPILIQLGSSGEGLI